MTDVPPPPRPRPPHTGRLLAALLTTAVLLGACGTGDRSGPENGADETGQDAAEHRETAAPSYSPAPVTPPPDAALPDKDAVVPPHSSCPPTGYRITPGVTDAAMGLRAMTVRLTNCGTEPLTVEGHPSIRVLDTVWQPMDVEITHDTSSIALVEGFDSPRRRVVLAPGEDAVAGLLWRNTVTDATVAATHGVHLEVSLTDGEPAQVVTPDGGLDLGNTGRLGVSAWSRSDG